MSHRIALNARANIVKNDNQLKPAEMSFRYKFRRQEKKQAQHWLHIATQFLKFIDCVYVRAAVLDTNRLKMFGRKYDDGVGVNQT